ATTRVGRPSWPATPPTEFTNWRGGSDEAARYTPVPARLQGGRRRAPRRARARDGVRRSPERRSHEAGVRRAQPQPQDAGPRGRRVRALGVERHHAVPGGEEAGVGALADGSATAGRRQPLAVLGAGALGAGLRHAGLRELREGALRPGRPRPAGGRARRAGVPGGGEDPRRPPPRPRLAGREHGDAGRLLRRELADLRADRPLPAGRLRRDRPMVPRPREPARVEGSPPSALATRAQTRQPRRV